MRLLSKSPKEKDSHFDPSDPKRMKHIRLGVWELYLQRKEQVDLSWVWEWSEWPFVSMYFTIREHLPYLTRMVQDVMAVEGCRPLFITLVLLEAFVCVLPALDIWCQGRLLEIVNLAVTKRIIDKDALFIITFSNILMVFVRVWVNKKVRQPIARVLNTRINARYDIHLFRASARLDLPTFQDPVVKSEIDHCTSGLTRSTLVFQAIQACLHTGSTLLTIGSQIVVLYRVLQGQPGGMLMAFFSSFYTVAFLVSTYGHVSPSWFATCISPDHVRSEGLRRIVRSPQFRKEVVAGGIHRLLVSLYATAMGRLGDTRTDSPHTLVDDSEQMDRLPYALIIESLRVLPSIVFALQCIRQPSSIPVSLASLELVRRNTNEIAFNCVHLKRELQTTKLNITSVKRLYEVVRIPNQVQVVPTKAQCQKEVMATGEIVRAGAAGGTQGHISVPDIAYMDPEVGIPFPEDGTSLAEGVSIEFRGVGFKYPGTEAWAVRDMSFKLERGGLCVIVGSNGSGKSTVLKLLARLYDPTEGQILIDGYDIRTLRLDDLRRAVSILFQDYTIFPVSLRDNIAFGDARLSTYNSLPLIEQAAELAGAAEVIRKLPQGYDTYLEHPCHDSLSYGYEGPKDPFEALGIEKTKDHDLSGGQKQRVALARTFVRTLADEKGVGLLLFDEPSAALDPIAEFELFERLRELRGNKSMIFSSHRFGNLTKHADLILYMDDSVIVESGTHNELISRDGKYATVWNVQAKAFL